MGWLRQFSIKKLLPLLPGFVRRKFELNRMLTLLARELVFSTEFDTPAKRRSATKRYICTRAKALQQPWPDLLTSVYKASCLPAAADEAYRLKLRLDLASTVCTDVDEVTDNILTILIRADACDPASAELFASIQSVLTQHCASWELLLIVADAHVAPDSISEMVGTEYQQRVHYVNDVRQAYQQASGILIHELSVGDSLHPELVGELSQRLFSHLEASQGQAFTELAGVANFDVLYTDHDHLDEDDERCQPVFKPDWSPDLFVQHNYIGPAVFFRAEFCRKHGADQSVSSLDSLLVVDGDGNGLIDDVFAAAKIAHIPKVLYHRRQKTNGGADDFRDSGSLSAEMRHSYLLPETLPEVTLIIPTRDRLDILQPCIDSVLQKTTYPAYHIIIVDNQSVESVTLEWLAQIEQDERVTVLPYDQPFNYAALNNFAVQQSSGDIVGLINNDVEVINPGWLEEMVRHAWRPEIGCVGAKLYYGDGRIQHAGVILGAGGGTAHSHRYFERGAAGYCGRLTLVQNVSAVTGACLLVRRELFEQVGGLEAEHLQIAWNDIDLCLKVQAAGYRNLWTPHAELYHHESVSRGRDVSPEQRQRYQAEKAWMQQRWGEALWRDPYYNPNLTAAREDFSLNMLYGL